MSICLIELENEHKSLFYDYYNEWVHSGEELTPAAINTRGMSYDHYLSYLKACQDESTCPKPFVPATLYVAVSTEGLIVGAVHIRHYLNDSLERVGGHIGYGVRPSQRRQGYAKEMLKQALAICKELGISRALVTCDHDNIASAKTILANGGEYCDESIYEGVIVQRYYINLSDRL